MSDDRDFSEKVESFWSNRGLEWSPDKALEHFTLYGPRKRSEALDLLDQEYRAFEPNTVSI